MTKPIPELTAKQQARFWAKVDVRGPDECWNWTGFIHPRGYGYVNINHSMLRSHRVALAIVGRNPLNLCACHTCDNPACVNPAHLFVGTHADNMADKKAKGRAWHPSGDAHYSNYKPECVARGENASAAKLTADTVLAIRDDSRPQRPIAADYGVCQTTIGRIKRREIWAHLA